MTPHSFGSKIASLKIFDKAYACLNQEMFFMTMKQEALLMDGITIMPIHPLEILEYQMPEVFLCGNILCSAN